MAELSVSTLIKLILGSLVVVVVVGAVYLFFRDRIISFFSSFSSAGANNFWRIFYG